LLRYYGVLSAHASLRAEVVPKKAVVPLAAPAQLPLFDESAPPSAKASAAKTNAEKTAEPSRHPWSWLLKRVFALEIMVCSRCGGALRIVKIATRPDEIARVRQRSLVHRMAYTFQEDQHVLRLQGHSICSLRSRWRLRE